MCSLKEAAASAVAKEPTSQGKKSAAAAKRKLQLKQKPRLLLRRKQHRLPILRPKKLQLRVFLQPDQKKSKFQLKSFYHKSAKQRIQLRICRQRDQSPPPPHQLGQCHRNALRRSTTTS